MFETRGDKKGIANTLQAARPAPPRPTARPVESVGAEPEEIRRRAYELYEARGREPGHDVEDWVRAENEIRNERRPGR